MLKFLELVRATSSITEWSNVIAKSTTEWDKSDVSVIAAGEKWFSLTNSATPPECDPDITFPNVLKFWTRWKVLVGWEQTGTSEQVSSPIVAVTTSKHDDLTDEYKCGLCGTLASSVMALKKHHQRFHGTKKQPKIPTSCKFCGTSFRDNYNVQRHQQRCLSALVQKGGYSSKSRLQLIFSETPDFTNVVVTQTKSYSLIRLAPRRPALDYDDWVGRAAAAVEPAIRRALTSIHGVKYQMRAFVNLSQATKPDDKSSCYFIPRSEQLLPADQDYISSQLTDMCDQLRQKLDNYISRGSGWVFDTVEFFDLSVARFEPIRGASYIVLPKFLASKKAIINIKNDDNRCFEWCLLAALFPVDKDREVTAKYEMHKGFLKFKDVNFPVQLRDIGTIEDQNDVAINVFGYEEEGGLHTLRITKRREKPESVINLLMLSQVKGVHYTLITNLDRLMYHTQKHRERHYFCVFCLHPYTTSVARSIHYQYCQDGQRVDLPEPGSVLKFTNYAKMLWKPVVIYADFECFLKPIEKEGEEDPSIQQSHMVKTHEHVPNSFGALAVRCCGCHDAQTYTTSDACLYRGENAAEQFLKYAISIGLATQKLLDEDKKMVLTPEQQKSFLENEMCHICLSKINYPSEKARDHCHVCGEYRGPAHVKCNYLYRKTRDIPVIMHNLRRYDGHLICLAVGKLAREHKIEIDCVPRGFDDYLSFSLTIPHVSNYGQSRSWKLQFIDSYQFLTSSLDSLAENLLGKNHEGLSKFQAVHQLIQDEEKIRLLLRKGVYPYEFMTEPDKFSCPELPSIETFYSRLKMCGASPDDYAHAQTVFRQFDCQNLGDYHDIYLKTDVMLLADVFENFRRVCRENYRLDPVHYITLPSLAWDACLLKTNVELDLLSDPDMYNFLEKSIRGGVSMVCHRYARANNPKLIDFDPDELISFIIYLDANNLYGWAMSQPMPISSFEWVLSEAERHALLENLLSFGDDEPWGLIFEVDMKFPEAIHDLQNDYPLAPEHLVIDNSMLSPYSQAMKHKLKCVGSKTTKLTPHLGDRIKYVVHYRNLKYYIQSGVEITAIHRVLRFRQLAWMKPYILFNTEMRKKAKTDFEKNFFKLANNAVFGKSMENVRRYRNIKLVVDDGKFRKLVACPRYQEHRMFGNTVYAVSLEQEAVRLCKPIYTGFTVLELSKLLMYQFHYGFIKKSFGSAAKLLFTDTDSLVYHITHENIDEVFRQNQELFDFSDYPPDHPLHSDLNKKVMGVFKDEMNGRQISEVVALKAKMNSILAADGSEKKTAKGVSLAVKKHILRHCHYLQTLMGDERRSDLMRRFQSIDHQLFTVEFMKTSLSAYDDKRFYLSDGQNSLAYGHHYISEELKSSDVEMINY